MTEPAPEETQTSQLTRLGRIFGSILAPTTVLTALLYFFGWSHAYYFFNEFGVNSTVLGLTTADYVQRSVDGLFVPITVVALAGLLALWGHTDLRARLATRPRVQRLLRYLRPAVAVAGLLLAAGGFVSVFVETELSRHVVAAPLSLGAGVLLLAYARPPRDGTGTGPSYAVIAEWAIVFILVAVSLFWAAGNYSSAVGTSRARRFVADLPNEPSVVIYSERSLSLSAAGVRETRCHDAQAAYRFRYDGLKLMLRSGDQYVLVPQTWDPATSTAILLPKSAPVRLEFVPTTNRTTSASPTC